jgi:hypothetical protein
MQIYRVNKTVKSAIALMLFPLLIALLYTPSFAGEIKYPVASYQGEELEKVREWEKTWAGKRITPANFMEIAEFLPESLVQVYKEHEKWGDFWFEIAPYEQIILSPGMIDATKKYAGGVKIGSSGELLNWTAGVPFPNAKTAEEMVFNHSKGDRYGDQCFYGTLAYIVDIKKKYDRTIERDGWKLFYSGRTDLDPKPELPNNTKGIYKGGHGEWITPAMLKGGRSLEIKWNDTLKDWGAWSFSATSRRVTRSSTAQRQTAFAGADFTRDDDRGYSYVVHNLNYKLLSRKELLLGRNMDSDKMIANHKPGTCLETHVTRQRINAYVVEAIHKDPNYVYGKQIWYFDPETWSMLYADKYDKQGRMWKIFDMPQTVTKMVDAPGSVAWTSTTITIDLQRDHATVGAFTNGKFGYIDKEVFNQTYYTPAAMLKYGY